MNVKRVQRIINALSREYPHAVITLKFKTPLQLLIAAMLSAQSTDEKVNQITPQLFERYKTCENFAHADLKELQKYIKPVGLYQRKSASIIEACKKILKDYKGEVPHTMEELTSLPGVGRKTANVLLSNGYNIHEGIIVDTHVKRLSQRLGLTKEKDPAKIEKDLMRIVPQREWLHLANLFLYHGRAVCHARAPACPQCVTRTCPSRRD